MGDTYMCTDNPVLLKHTVNERTIICPQRQASKSVVTEEQIVEANKLAFNDDIGVITNHVTSMFEVRAGYKKGSKEYRTLTYRIMCGQMYQQNAIDRAKGIIAKPMSPAWYSIRDNMIRDGDSEETVKQKKFNMSIVAARKPYFMIYVYPNLAKQYREYVKNSDYGVAMRFFEYGLMSIDDLIAYEPKTKEMQEYLDYYERFYPVGQNPCTVNRICRYIEKQIGEIRSSASGRDFDYTILKSPCKYHRNKRHEIAKRFDDYQSKNKELAYISKSMKVEKGAIKQRLILNNMIFKAQCEQICTNQDELCNIVLDLCYKSNRTKTFAWDISGEVILQNLYRRNHGMISYPVLVEDGEGDFEYCGQHFVMRTLRAEAIADDYFE